MKPIKQFFHSELPIALLIILLGALLSCLFKTVHQITFINPDELLWMLRSNFFIEHFLNGNFSEFIQSSQPGIMVMWLAGPIMYLSCFDFSLISNLLSDLKQAGIPYNVINSNNPIYYQPYQKLSFLFNLPLLSILFIFTLCFYASLRKLRFSKIKSLTALSFLVSSPFYFLFFTTPTDKLVTVFMTLSLFSLLIYTNNKKSKKFLVASAVLAAWAVLSKLSALFLLPFSLLVLFIYGHKNIKEVIKNYSLWLIIFLITAAIFLPTLIANPETVINLLTDNGQNRLIANPSGTGGFSFFLFFIIALTYLSDSSLISIGPLALICLAVFFILALAKPSLRATDRKRSNLVAIIQKIKLRNHFTIHRNSKNIFILILCLFLFFIFITIFSKTYSFRYLAPLFPIIYLLAGIGLVNLIDLLIKKYQIPKKLAYFEMIVLIFLSQLLFIFTSQIEKIETLPDFH